MPSYNLIIFHNPRAQQISDFQTIRNMMADAAPDIEVHIITSDIPVNSEVPVPEEFWRRAAKRPTLIFSPIYVKFDERIRGARIINFPVSKVMEVKLLDRAGFAAPRTGIVKPKTVLDEAQWGPFVVLKPNAGSRGRGIRLTRTRDVHYVDPMSWPEGDPKRGKEWLFQQFIDTGPYASSYRVFTVLGEVIYCAQSVAKEPTILPDKNSGEAVDIPIAVNDMQRELRLSNDQEVIALAQSVHRKLPQYAIMATDIVRHKKSGQLFIMEINSAGWNWHLSSPFGLKQQRTYGVDFYSQFNALETISKALVETTRRIAV